MKFLLNGGHRKKMKMVKNRVQKKRFMVKTEVDLMKPQMKNKHF